MTEGGRPDPFPWLARLRKDQAVPFVNAWGRTRVGYDPGCAGSRCGREGHVPR